MREKNWSGGMAPVVSEDSGVGRSLEGNLNGQRCEALAEWRSSDQVESGSPSTSPPYWDTDDDDEGAKPSELYGKHTWKIEKFSQINKRELRSSVFEVGGYKWYILIYPQGCDVCNHLSLFLCVANHDKLLPGWSHFAQFTIAVVNKDPKKSKYSDTLHRFWKKEHDWGWKKFMELSKVLDGFIDADALIIKAQVQVIRERSDRPFRCLDCQYRRELVRVYLSNVEQICRKTVDEKRKLLRNYYEDKAGWSSLCTFWLGMDQNAKRCMSREKTDVILKTVVKKFFVEKEVVSTLIMDSLYSGLKALEGQSKCSKGRAKSLDSEEMLEPFVHVENDLFALIDDVLLLLERVIVEQLPQKEEKGPQNRSKDAGCGEDFNKDSIERDERRLTELGRRTVEVFVLDHIFSQKIAVAYQEAVALRRQEELIREEEEAGLAESEQKAKRGAEKEKKLKKKQAKQKRNSRKGKDKGREERPCATLQVKQEKEIATDEVKDLMMEQAQVVVLEKSELLDDVSDASDSIDCVTERDQSPVNWDTDTSEAHPLTEASSSGISGLSCVQNGTVERKSSSMMDDSSSTCSTDSVPSVATNGPYRGNSLSNCKGQKSPNRGGKNQRGKGINDGPCLANVTDDQPSGPATDAGDLQDVPGSCKRQEYESEAVLSLQDRLNWLEQHVDEGVVSSQRKPGIKEHTDVERPTHEKAGASPSSPWIHPRNLLSDVQLKSEFRCAAVADLVLTKKSCSPQQTDKPAPSTSSQVSAPSRPDSQKAASKPTEKPAVPLPVPAMSRPSSAPLIPGPRPPAPVISMVHTAPLLARSVSAAGRLGPDPSPAMHSCVPQSYRNAMMGTTAASSSASFAHPHPLTSAVNTSPAYSQPPTLSTGSVVVPQSSERVDLNSVRHLSFGMINRDAMQNGHQWNDCPRRDDTGDHSSLPNDVQNYDLCKSIHVGLREQLSAESTAGTSGRQTQGIFVEEFPHLDIINDLLDDEHGIGKAARASRVLQSPSNGAHFLNRHYSFHGDMGISSDMESPTSSSHFERTLSYQGDGFQRAYGSSGNHFNSFSDYIPQGNPLPYANGQIDGLVTNQWQLASSDLSLLSMGSTDGDVYPYRVPEYPSLACGVNGYTVFRPSNGH